MKRLALVSFLFVAAACSDQKEDSVRPPALPAAHADDAMAAPAMMHGADMAATPAASHAGDMVPAGSATPAGEMKHPDEMKHPEMKDDVKDAMKAGVKKP